MKWFPDWTGQTCAIVAGGPSVTQADVDALRGQCRVIVVNNAYQLAPWADALYAADERWWTIYRPEFSGLKITCHLAKQAPHDVHRVQLCEHNDPRFNEIITDGEVIGRGGNSAFQALNLAIIFGSKRILLLGVDFCGEHWHPDHPEPLKRTRDSKRLEWRDALDAQSKRLEEIGICLLNCSPISLLRNYPKVAVLEAMKSASTSMPPRCSCSRPEKRTRAEMTERV